MSLAPLIHKRTRLGYRPEFDGIRGVGLLVVLTAHTSVLFSPGLARTARLYSGHLGLDAFFVLSGFLITTLLLEERASFGNISLSRFYWRRALRILPALAFGLAVAGVATAIVGENLSGVSFSTAARSTALMVANWSEESLGFLAHTWSLGLEEQFYLVWPVVLILILRRGASSVRVAAGLIAAGVSVGVMRALYLHGWEPGDLVDGILRSDGIMFGTALAVLMKAAPETVKRFVGDRRTVACALAVLALFAGYVELSGRAGNESVTKDLLVFGNAALALLLGKIVLGDAPKASSFLRARPVVALGRISYSTYLVHYPVFQTVARIGPNNPVVDLVVSWSISFVLAVASYKLIERPALRYKDRFFGRRAPAPADQVQVPSTSGAAEQVPAPAGTLEPAPARAT